VIVGRSGDTACDTLPLRSLAIVEVSDRTKTSGFRALGGLVLGATAGALAGGLTAVIASRSRGGEDLGNLPAVFGGGIGAVFGGFAGLIIGQNPVPVWDRLYGAPVDDSSPPQ